MNLKRYQRMYLVLFTLSIAVTGFSAWVRYVEYREGLTSTPSKEVEATPLPEDDPQIVPQDDTQRVISNGPMSISPQPRNKERDDTPRVFSNRGMRLSR